MYLAPGAVSMLVSFDVYVIVSLEARLTGRAGICGIR